MASVLSNKSRATVYVDRGGCKIHEIEWKKLRMDPNYTTIREYDNGTYSVRVGWLGEIQNAGSTHPDHWKFYVVAIGKHIPGSAVLEPCDETERYRTETEAIVAYEDFLVRRCECKWVPSNAGQDDFGHVMAEYHFVERNNQLKPLSADTPTTVGAVDASLVGSW